MHLRRVRKHGNPGPAEKLRHTSPNPSKCTLDGCSGVPKAHGLCEGHYQRWWKTGDPGSVEIQRRTRSESLGYHGVHHRLREQRGPATEHPCQRCGAPAAQWAYDHGDPDERQDPKRGPYSTDPAHYMPLCHGCHKRFDVAHRQRPTEDVTVPA